MGLRRFDALKEYFIQLSDVLTASKLPRDKLVVFGLTDEDKKGIRGLCTTIDDVYRAEILESVTDHDTAAAGDLLKFEIAHKIPHLEEMIDGVHFAMTSEDVMSIVFGTIANDIVYKHFIPEIINFSKKMMSYMASVEKTDSDRKPLVVPGLTHVQAAEPTTGGKKFMNSINAIDFLISRMMDENGFQEKWVAR